MCLRSFILLCVLGGASSISATQKVIELLGDMQAKAKHGKNAEAMEFFRVSEFHDFHVRFLICHFGGPAENPEKSRFGERDPSESGGTFLTIIQKTVDSISCVHILLLLIFH